MRLVSYGVIAYMLMAFAWWSVLLFTKNRDAFYAKRDLMRIGMVARGLITTDEEFFASERYQELEQQYRWQEWMIFGEALFFVLSLVGGIWLINRGYHKEVMAAKQRRNFLLSITHELKSPLASIRLVLETLQKRGQLKREQVEKLAGNGLFETDRLHMLVEDLLLSAKLETAYQPHTEPLNLSNMLQDLVDKLRNKYPRVDFHFEENVDDATLVGDKSGLTSVALNLLENAVKYSRIRALASAIRKKYSFSKNFTAWAAKIPAKQKARGWVCTLWIKSCGRTTVTFRCWTMSRKARLLG